MTSVRKVKRERAIIVGIVTSDVRREQATEYLDELTLLADTAGAEVIHRVVQERNAIDPSLYIGKGKVEQIAALAEDDDVSLIIFDDDLSPAQVKNLEERIKRKIVDRSGLILDIFARRARTSEARTQVELAQLEYLLPRLTRQWTHLSKQYGGIGTKGPGETQIETDRRLVRTRISHLKEKLDQISRQRATRRRRRKELPTAALVGYTNAGKSTLMNALADAGVFVENRLFATLDTTTRRVTIAPNSSALLSDTVGFIRKLPAHLVASFKSTLEEVVEADLLLHVVDIAHSGFEEHIEVVKKTLEDLGAGQKPVLYVFNKTDALEDRAILTSLSARFSPSLAISAQRGINLVTLRERISELLRRSRGEEDYIIPYEKQQLMEQIPAFGTIVATAYEEERIHVRVRTNAEGRKKIAALLSPKSRRKKS
ncbi:MAG: GTPase HflX [Ignavibacteriales bacterium]|nr:GTPase HflX [Ignavibacteriales bacterium]